MTVPAQRARKISAPQASTSPKGNRTVILWQEVDLVGGKVVRRVVLTLDATMSTVTVLTCPEAIEVAQAILAAAR